MNRILTVLCMLALFTSAAHAARQPRERGRQVKSTRVKAVPQVRDFEQANARTADSVTPDSKGPAVLRAQILLDRANFSPGEIDAAYGANLRSAIRGFQTAHQLPASDILGTETWALLDADVAPVLIRYDVSPEDVAGPFETIPADMMQKSKLRALTYQSTLELLGEKFHVSPKLLALLNKEAAFDRPGESILVPNVGASFDPVRKAASVLVRKSDMTVSALDEQGAVIAQFPASVGSEHDPLPLGKWKINGVGKTPVFRYNPALFWDADSKQSAATIAAGPNNPVGVVWIDLSKPHYGIHGTPEPAKVGHTQSHGCIRLTNWDAMRLAAMVSPGMPAELKE